MLGGSTFIAAGVCEKSIYVVADLSVGSCVFGCWCVFKDLLKWKMYICNAFGFLKEEGEGLLVCYWCVGVLRGSIYMASKRSLIMIADLEMFNSILRIVYLHASS